MSVREYPPQSADPPWSTPGGVLSPPTRRAARLVSVVVAGLALVATVAGLLVSEVYTGSASVAQILRGFDLVTLVVVVPTLLWAVRSAASGSDRAQLVWGGMLACLAYTYAYHVFGTPFNDLFLLHIAILAGSIFGLVLTLMSTDVPGIGRRFDPRTPRRAIAVLLGLLGLGLGAMWVIHSAVYAVTGEIPVGSALVETDTVVHLGIALDLALLVPAYALSAVLLWQGRAWGYVLAALVLVSGVVHQISYMVAMPFQAVADVPGAVAFDPMEPVIAAIFLGATVLLLRGAGTGASQPRSA
jgi:hypothetical protein